MLCCAAHLVCLFMCDWWLAERKDNDFKINVKTAVSFSRALLSETYIIEVEMSFGDVRVMSWCILFVGLIYLDNFSDNSLETARISYEISFRFFCSMTDFKLAGLEYIYTVTRKSCDGKELCRIKFSKFYVQANRIFSFIPASGLLFCFLFITCFLSEVLLCVLRMVHQNPVAVALTGPSLSSLPLPYFNKQLQGTCRLSTLPSKQ